MEHTGTHSCMFIQTIDAYMPIDKVWIYSYWLADVTKQVHIYTKAAIADPFMPTHTKACIANMFTYA